MREKVPQIFTRINKQGTPVDDTILDTIEQEAMPESLVRKYVRTILEANEYGWEVSSKKNMMLDKEGMEQTDKDRQEDYLKSMALMESQTRGTKSSPIRMPLSVTIPDDLRELSNIFSNEGQELYIVGGAVRDALLNKTPKDYDLATGAAPEAVIDIVSQEPSNKVDLTGKSFGVVRVWTAEGNEYEIATFRRDIGTGRRPDSVEFTSIEDDVKRRDLTINALFYDMRTGEVVDYVGGIEDVKNGIVRAVGNPIERFDEDRLRILRAVRFAGRMDADLDPETKQAILEDNNISEVSPERIRDEIVKGITSSRNVGHFLGLLNELNLYSQVLPGLTVSIDTGTNSRDITVQLSLMLNDNDSVAVKSVLKRMKYSNDEVDAVNFLMNFSDITKDTAPAMKKEFNRIKMDEERLKDYAEASGIEPRIVSAFLRFSVSPTAMNPRDLMSQGLRGPDIGAAMKSAESEAYSRMLDEIRVYIRELLIEQEVKFSGILKLMPSPEIVNNVSSLLQQLPPEAVPLPEDKFHVTLAHQSVLKPYKKQLKQLSKDGMLPPPPTVTLEGAVEERADEALDRKSWVVWVSNQDELKTYVQDVIQLVGGPPGDPEPSRRFHISIANLTGNPGDSVR
jgi:tRNA nucleotidyltransferase/poly(A) polymerase